MEQDLFEPLELIEPLSLVADIEFFGQVVIRCNGPGFICATGSCQ